MPVSADGLSAAAGSGAIGINETVEEEEEVRSGSSSYSVCIIARCW